MQIPNQKLGLEERSVEMEVNEFIRQLINCPELKEDSNQSVLVLLGGKKYEVKELWLRGDNSVIIEVKE